jgi:hypothetical protein
MARPGEEPCRTSGAIGKVTGGPGHLWIAALPRYAIGMPRDKEEPSFAELMAREGVEPLSGRGVQGQAPGSARVARPGPPRAEMSEPARVDPAAGPARTPTGPARAPEPVPRPVDLAAENARLVQALAQADARSAAAANALQQARQAGAAAEQTQHALDAERRGLAEQTRRLRASLAEQERRAAEHVPLREVLTRRGLLDTGEMIAALQGLLSQRAPELLDAIELTTAAPLMHVLDQHLALVHDPTGHTLGDATVIVRVPPERCEITGGSDIRASFHRLVTACERVGVGALTVVGGSPAYRQQLDTLAAPHRPALRLNLVSGTRRRERRRAEADMRKSDVVVIWSATELDHSVSALYTAGSTPTLHVPHRGISRMLDHVAAWLEARRP